MGSVGASASMGRVLLVCDDSIAIQHLSEGMQQLAIATEVCVEVSTSLRSLNRKNSRRSLLTSG
jgi:transposase